MVQRSEDIRELREQYDAATVALKTSILSRLATQMQWSTAGDFLKGIADDDESLRYYSFSLLRRWHEQISATSDVLRQPDKAYVMHVYYSSTFHEDRLPADINEILKEIPFLFGENG